MRKRNKYRVYLIKNATRAFSSIDFSSDTTEAYLNDKGVNKYGKKCCLDKREGILQIKPPKVIYIYIYICKPFNCIQVCRLSMINIARDTKSTA